MGNEFTIARYIQSLAEQYGDRPAVRFKSAFRTFSFTYREIYDRTVRVANYLARKGIRKGDRVLIWSYNGQEYASILLGCALSGVVAVPVDFSSKADWVETIGRRVGAKYLFHSKRRPYAKDDMGHIHVEDLDEEIADVAIERTDFGVEDDDVYEIVFTSGTTSDPKGVVITNRNIVSNFYHAAQVMPIASYHRFLSILPLSHMFEQVAGFLYPLYNGCTVTYLYSRKSSTIVDALQREQVTAMVVVPALLQVLRENILREARARGIEKKFERLLAMAENWPTWWKRLVFRKVHMRLGGKLEMFITGGSALDPELERFWNALGFAIYQGYGLTEASPVVALNTPAHHRRGSVGRALPQQEIRLAEQNEIWIRGDHITPGYFESPAANAAAFADGWYRTGDIGEIDADGFVFIRGRLKNMLKSSAGINIYPEDIETALSRVPGVKDSCVIGLEEGGDVRVHAVLLLDKSRAWDDASVRAVIESANRELQPHQHIQGVTLWPHEDFPRTNTLKIKRGPVREEMARMAAGAAPVAMQASGDRIVDVIADMAKIDPARIRPESSLVTDLGLDSIARVELATLLEEEFNVEVDEASITPRTTIADLRGMIADKQRAAASVRFSRWPMSWPVRFVRGLMRPVMWVFPSLFSRITVRGLENLEGVTGPVIFIANHISHYDPVFLVRALPMRFRRMAVAAASDILFDEGPKATSAQWMDTRFRGFWSMLLLNAFPFSRNVHVKRSFEYMGKLIDGGWNVLLFPEGKLTLDGKMDRFKSGIGLLAQAMQVPIVPMRIDGLYEVVNWERWIPMKYGRVTIHIGAPIRPDWREEPTEIARECEEAIRALGGQKTN